MGEKIFYIVVNLRNMMARHNYELTGQYASANGYTAATAEGRSQLQSPDWEYSLFVPNPKFSGQVSLFTLSSTSDYCVEWAAEAVRRQSFPQYPSRMSAIFAFDTKEEYLKAHHKYGWRLDNVHQFRLKSGYWHKVNMEIVSLMRGVYIHASWSDEHLQSLWSAYWAGQGDIAVDIPHPFDIAKRQTCHSGEIWECLIEGVVERVSNEPVVF